MIEFVPLQDNKCSSSSWSRLSNCFSKPFNLHISGTLPPRHSQLVVPKGLYQRWWQSGMCSLKHNVFVIHCVLSNKLSKRLIQWTIEACRLLSSCNCVFSKETTWAWWISKIYLSTYSGLRLRAPQSFAWFTHPRFYQICFKDPC